MWGGLIFLRDSIPFIPIKYEGALEAVLVRVFINEKEFTICNIYIPPKFDNKILLDELDKIKQLLEMPFILTADANGHHYLWGSPYADARGKILCEWATDNNYVITNSGDPTYLSESGTYSHIDITISSNNIATQLNWGTAPELFNSDHFPIIVAADIECPAGTKQKRWCLRTANWDGYREVLVLPSEYSDPTNACTNVINSIKEAAHYNNNIRVSKGGNKQLHCNTWWNGACNESWKEKKVAFNKYKNNRTINNFIAFKKARARLRRTIVLARQESWDSYVGSINSATKTSEVWRKIRIIDKKPPPAKRIVIKDNDKYIHKEEEVANLFALHYSSLGLTEDVPECCASSRGDAEEFEYSQLEEYNRDFTMSEFRQALTLTKSSAPGPDYIPADFITNMNRVQLKQILHFYNYIWNRGIPKGWKESIVFPLLKYGKIQTCIESYRPISLTNSMCKILERMVTKRLIY